jgi:hypothetical protein
MLLVFLLLFLRRHGLAQKVHESLFDGTAEICLLDGLLDPEAMRDSAVPSGGRFPWL